MATVLDRPDVLPQRPAPSRHARPTRGSRVAAWLRARRSTLLWFTPALALVGAVQAYNLGGTPQQFDDEGTYVAQAYAVGHLGELTHYTYIYDHPPLGWLQMAAWFDLTGALSRYSSAVLAGREFMLVMALASAALLWMLARRLRLSQPAATLAVALFGLSPLAIQFHRSVYLDNIAVPWLLAAFVLALAPRRQLLGYAASGAAFAVAVLTKETFLLFLPFLAWQVWRGAHPQIRRYSLSVAATVSAMVAGSYVLFATLKGELIPGAHRSSLLHGVFFQLVGRTPSGSLADPHSLARVTLGQWWALDPVLMVAAPVAALACLWVRRLRPLAAALLFLVLFMLRPGYLPVPYVIALLPLAALLVVGAVEQGLRIARAGRTPVRRWTAAVVPVVAAGTAVAVAAPLWHDQLNGLLHTDLDRPMVQATAWVERNVPRHDRLVVDDSMWVDLVRAGFPQDDVVWYYKVDTDPAVTARAPQGWRDYDYVVTTNSLRTFPDKFPIVSQAIAHSTAVATFGTGALRVQVLRVDHPGAGSTAAAGTPSGTSSGTPSGASGGAGTGTAAGSASAAADLAARQAAGRRLVARSGLDLAPGVADLIADGRLDSRVMTALSAAPLFVGRVTVAALPAVAGEDRAGLPRRQVLITAVDGRPVTHDAATVQRVSQLLRGRYGVFFPASVTSTPQGLLATWPRSSGSTTPGATG